MTRLPHASTADDPIDTKPSAKTVAHACREASSFVGVSGEPTGAHADTELNTPDTEGGPGQTSAPEPELDSTATTTPSPPAVDGVDGGFDHAAARSDGDSAPASSAPDLDAIEADLDGVDAALGRLADGTYWTDEVTGAALADDLLASDPIARRA